MGESTTRKFAVAHCPAVLQYGTSENNALGITGKTLLNPNLLLDASDRVVHVDAQQHD